jgi:hypothetical protein
MARDQSNPPAQLITLEIARAAGQAHGETAFTAMVSPEIFEESLRVAVAEWRSAGFTSACLDEAEAAARAAYQGSSAGCRAGEARRRQLEPDNRTVVERLGIEDFPSEDWALGPWGHLPIATSAPRA